MDCIFSSISLVCQIFAKVQVMLGLSSFSHKTLSDRLERKIYTDGDEPMADLLLPPSGEPFSWDDRTQLTAPFLWTLADIAHALDIDLPTAKRWHDEGNIPAPAWNEPILYENWVASDP